MLFRASKLLLERPWLFTDADDVLSDLRPEDLYEFSAMGSTPQLVSQHIRMLVELGEAWVLYWKDAPVFVWGIAQTTPGIFTLWGFGTKQTRRAMPHITRWGMSWWLPTLRDRIPNIRRIEVRVPVSSVHSINWLRKLGMEIEARLPNYSVHGEDVFQLAMNFPRVSDVQHTGLSPSELSLSSGSGRTDSSSGWTAH